MTQTSSTRAFTQTRVYFFIGIKNEFNSNVNNTINNNLTTDKAKFHVMKI